MKGACRCKRSFFGLVGGGDACQVLVVNEIWGMVCVCWGEDEWAM